MTRIFNLDNPVWNFLGKLTDMIVLTVLWVTVSIPVITAGASTAALYDISLQLAENQEGYIVRSFFAPLRKTGKKVRPYGWEQYVLECSCFRTFMYIPIWNKASSHTVDIQYPSGGYLPDDAFVCIPVDCKREYESEISADNRIYAGT